MQPLISIIVPIYNVEKYLDRCIQSIVDQTYKNLEIILVDDGSTDNCGEICDAWAERDDRIKVVHKENGGQATARNEGRKISIGEFINYIDADDCIDPQMIETLYDVLEKNNADIIECGFEKFTDNNEILYSTNEEIQNAKIAEVNAETAISEVIDDGMFRQMPPVKLSRREIAIETKFPGGLFFEDELWACQLFSKAHKIVKIDIPFYKYYTREDSTVNSEYSVKKLDAIKVKEKRSEFLRKAYPSLYEKSLRDFAGTCKYQFQWICRSKGFDNDKVIRNNLHKKYVSIDKTILTEGKSIKEKIRITGFRTAPYLTSKIRNKFKIGL